jgi:Leucine-rich repeat (LRR) protein
VYVFQLSLLEQNYKTEFRCYQAGKHTSPTAGSFIRPSRPVDQPLGFLQALQKKYASDNSNSAAFTSSGKGLERPIEISGKVVEEVGFEKIRQQLARFYELQIVLLDGLCIAGVAPDVTAQHGAKRSKRVATYRESCPKITELDLSRNLFETWGEVAGVCVALPSSRALKPSAFKIRRRIIPVLNVID